MLRPGVVIFPATKIISARRAVSVRVQPHTCSKGAADRRIQYCHQEKIMRKRIRSYLSTRRSFLRGGLAAPAVVGAGLMANALPAAADFDFDDRPTHGDINILRFLAALEILETDLWQQYNEL